MRAWSFETRLIKSLARFVTKWFSNELFFSLQVVTLETNEGEGNVTVRGVAAL